MASAALLWAASGAVAQPDTDWSGGIGYVTCDELENTPDKDIVLWTQGYWTGANLYLGGSDLCLERADFSGLSDSNIRVLIGVQCAGNGRMALVAAAFNALKGLPTLEGSRAAKCGLSN